MDKSNKNQRPNRAALPQTVTRADVRKAVKSAPNELFTDKVVRTSLKGATNLKDSFVICCVAPNEVQEQFTVHHPIGLTDCQAGDWVMTKSSDLHYLLSRTEDPNQLKVNTARNERKNLHLVTKKILEKDEKGAYYYPSDRVKTRNEYLSEAELHMRADKTETKGARPPNRVDYLGEPQMKAEIAILKQLKTEEAQTFIKAAEGSQSFRTRGGILEDQDQLPIVAMAGASPAKAYDTVVKSIFKVIGQGEGITVQTIERVTPAEPSPPEQEEGSVEAVDYKHLLETALEANKECHTLLSGLINNLNPAKAGEMVKKLKDIQDKLYLPTEG